MPRRYKKPPLIEALCEFQFEGTQPWDWTVPGLVYEKIRYQFPIRRQENAIEVAFQPGENKILQQMKAGVAKMQFVQRNEAALVQVGPNLLAVNHLRPYPGWATFKAMIMENLQIYRAIVEPKGLRRIGVRYINRIEIPGEKVPLEEYFRLFPQIPETLPQDLQSCLLQVDIPYTGPTALIRVIFATVPSGADGFSPFMLDLDVFAVGTQCPSLENAPEWIDAAHMRVEEAFDASFTEKSHKAVFEEETA